MIINFKKNKCVLLELWVYQCSQMMLNFDVLLQTYQYNFTEFIAMVGNRQDEGYGGKMSCFIPTDNIIYY